MRLRAEVRATEPESMRSLPSTLLGQAEALEARFGGRLAIAAHSLETGETLERRSKETLPSASLIKVAIMAAYEAACASRELSPDETLGPTGESAATLVREMIRVSDNEATNVLIERLGMERVNALCESLGMDATRLRRRMLDWETRQRGVDNTTSAADMLRILTSIARRELVSPEASERMWQVLRDQDHREMIPSGLPRECEVGNKTGGLDDVDHDAAIARTPVGDMVVVLMFAEVQAGEEVRGALRDLAAAIYGHFASPVLRVESDPPGLPVLAAGRSVGTTPCILPFNSDVEYSGLRALALVVDGQARLVQTPPLEPGGRTTLHVRVDGIQEG